MATIEIREGYRYTAVVHGVGDGAARYTIYTPGGEVWATVYTRNPDYQKDIDKTLKRLNTIVVNRIYGRED